MLTFVVNLHPSIPNMALAEPLLYPLQKEGKIQLVFPLVQDLQARIDAAYQTVKEQLARQHYTQWQVVFLVGIDIQQSSPFKDSLSAKMLLIRKLFLAHFTHHLRPRNTFLLAIDHVNEDKAIPAVHISPVYRDSWELDTHGFIRNPESFFVAQADISALDHIWHRKVNIDRNTIVNLGFDRLPLEIQEQVNQAIDDITEDVEEILHLASDEFRKYKITRQISYIDAETIQAIKDEFFERLHNIKNDPSRYKDFSPAATLRTAIADHLGIFSEDNVHDFQLIRFPMQYGHEDILQRYLIKLAILLTMIAEQEKVIKNLARKNYLVSIQLDDANVQQYTYNYLESLYNVERQLKQELHAPKTIKAPLLTNKDCSCAENLENRNIPNMHLGVLANNGDLAKWKQWNGTLDGLLTKHRDSARHKMQICIFQNHQKQTETTITEVNNIDQKMQELEREKSQLQSKVEHSFLSKNMVLDWNIIEEQQSLKIKPVLFSRPTASELAILMVTSSLILLLPFIHPLLQAETQVYQIAYYPIIIVAVILISLMALWLGKRRYQKDIDKIVQATFDKARQIRMSITDTFGQQKAYLESLCHLNMVRTNYETVGKAKSEQNNWNLLLDYHRRKLTDHQAIAQKILRVFKANERTLTNQFNAPLPKTDIQAPLQANEIYTPLSFMPEVSQRSGQEAKIENTAYPIQHKVGHLVANLRFEQDRVYMKQ